MVVGKGNVVLRFKVFRGMLWFNIKVRYAIVESYQKVNLRHHGWLRHGRRYRWRHVPNNLSGYTTMSMPAIHFTNNTGKVKSG